MQAYLVKIGVWKAEDKSVQDPGKYEGMSPEHSVCNAFK